MKQRNLIIIGVFALISVASMNFSHCLGGYGFINGNLCVNVLAQSTTTGGNSSTGGSSSSTSGGSSSTGGSSSSSSGGGSTTGGTSGTSTGGSHDSSNRFDIIETKTETKYNEKVYKESVVIDCDRGNFTDKCVKSCKFRTIEDNGIWSSWMSCGS